MRHSKVHKNNILRALQEDQQVTLTLESPEEALKFRRALYHLFKREGIVATINREGATLFIAPIKPAKITIGTSHNAI